MKLRIKPSYEVPKKSFPNYITNNQFASLKTSVYEKSHSFGKVIIFSDNPALLKKMNEKKKKIYTSPNSSKRVYDEEDKKLIRFPNENIVMNKDFKSKKITQFDLRRNLYLPKINNLLKTVVPRYEREALNKKKIMETTNDERLKRGNNFVQLNL